MNFSKYIAYTLIAAIFVACIYAANAFFYLSWNPADWQPGARFLIAALTFLLALILFATAFNQICESYKDK